MNLTKKYTNFVSDMDKLLISYDQTHALTPTQQKELEKYLRIYQMRDSESQSCPV